MNLTASKKVKLPSCEVIAFVIPHGCICKYIFTHIYHRLDIFVFCTSSDWTASIFTPLMFLARTSCMWRHIVKTTLIKRSRSVSCRHPRILESIGYLWDHCTTWCALCHWQTHCRIIVCRFRHVLTQPWLILSGIYVNNKWSDFESDGPLPFSLVHAFIAYKSVMQGCLCQM